MILLTGVLTSAPVSAQVSNPAPNPVEPPGPYVIDVRAAMAGLPSGAEFFPPISSDTLVPARGFGFDVGGHVLLFQLGPSRVGIGASVVRVRGAASTRSAATAPESASNGAVGPHLAAIVTAVSPQLSFNFGTAEGWSYLSAGLGVGHVRSTVSPTSGGTGDEETTRESGSIRTLNYGGGARWFLSDHLAIGFDLRFYKLSAGNSSGTALGTPATTLFGASVGLSLR